MTVNELELAAEEVIAFLRKIDQPDYADIVRQLEVRYKAARITTTNYRKALGALENANKQSS